MNSTFLITAEVFKKAGTYDEKMLLGVTILDVVRAKNFYVTKAKVMLLDEDSLLTLTAEYWNATDALELVLMNQ
ncbi:Malate dehydrogenase, mitochondrial [Capsicum chinense]|nr:Malate dehydrogenase, mitochondrial [Capsicum chinense]